jgi:hypothetical protein
MCNWVHMPDRLNPTERRCSNPGQPYCDVELHWHSWLELRDLADLSRREDAARKTKKLLCFRT